MTVADLRLGLALGGLLSGAVVLTNVVIPSLLGHPTPDTMPSESIGWIAVIGIIGWAGIRRVARASSLTDAIVAGALSAFVAFAMVMTTFLVIDNLFLGLVSEQPEKIWLFEHSGFADMRSYLNHTNLRAFWTVLPLVTLLGGACGLAGGYLALVARRRQRSD